MRILYGKYAYRCYQTFITPEETRLPDNFRAIGGSGLMNPYGIQQTNVVPTVEDCVAIAEIQGWDAVKYTFASGTCETGTLNYLGSHVGSQSNTTLVRFIRKNSEICEKKEGSSLSMS